MASDQEKFEKQERAARLKAARETAKISGPKGVVAASDGKVNENVYKGHESGRNGFTVSDGRVYADLFGVSLEWLYLGMDTVVPADKMSPELSLRSALLAYGVDSEDLKPVLKAINGFLLSAADERSRSDHPRDQSEPASRRRESTP